MSFPGLVYLKEPAGNGSLVGDAPVVAVGTGVALLAHTHHVVPAERRIQPYAITNQTFSS